LIKRIAADNNAFILRVPSPTGTMLADRLSALGKPYVLEVVGDPSEMARFLPGPRIFREYLRLRWRIDLLRIVSRAAGILYVTRRYLQERYPAAARAFVAGVSDAVIPSEAIANPDERVAGVRTAQEAASSARPLRIGAVGQLYAIKCPLEIVRAVAACFRRGVNLELVFAGTGPLEKALIQEAARLGLADRVRLAGRIPAGKPMFEFLASLDLYVQFSRTEGLPRSVVEAMASGCPVIGSRVGGIPELLPSDMLVPPGDTLALADKMFRLLNNPAKLRQAVRENVAKTSDFLDARLERQRDVFYAQAAELFRRSASVEEARTNPKDATGA
jgi:glycosyltransferase involved in cell wall biosynthesis